MRTLAQINAFAIFVFITICWAVTATATGQLPQNDYRPQQQQQQQLQQQQQNYEQLQLQQPHQQLQPQFHRPHRQKHTQRQHRRHGTGGGGGGVHRSLRHGAVEGELLTPRQRNASDATTRLRRISARDYFNNNVLQQRRSTTSTSPPAAAPPALSPSGTAPHNEWAYHTYDVLTNTYNPVMPRVGGGGSSGKGDDNTDDVEFISSSNPDWSAAPTYPRRGSFTTIPPSVRRAIVTGAPPPPLVPARRGYAMTSTTSTTTTTTTTTTTPQPPPSTTTRATPIITSTSAAPTTSTSITTTTTRQPPIEMPHQPTEDPFDNNAIGKNSPLDPREMEKRHICVQQRTVKVPVKTTEVYTRPIWKHVSTPCQPQTHVNQMCTRVQLMHEQAYRDVIRHKSSQQITYDCCQGWARESLHTDGCMKPICSARCQNGGSCTGPDTCSCASGFTGRYCEQDINECMEEKPCDQMCHNTYGSYMCKCREGFVLQSDQQSCKKIDLHADDAFEARDLENEIENNEDVSARLHKIERSLASERVHTHELQKSLQATYSVVDTLKSRLVTLEKQQQDINRLQTNLFATESRTNKLEGMLNLLIKCRNGPNAYCP